jgi:hypothetical protein
MRADYGLAVGNLLLEDWINRRLEKREMMMIKSPVDEADAATAAARCMELGFLNYLLMG